jgi:hypothetical protein
LSANGYFSFIDPNPADSTQDLIPSIDPENAYLIALLWDDLDPRNQQAIFVKNLTNPDRVVVEFKNIKHYPYTSSNIQGTFQIVFMDTGDIYFNFLSILYLDGYTCGLNFGDGTYYNDYRGLFTGMNDYSIKFSYNGILNQPPILSVGNINATTGNVNNNFLFSVVYQDPDNDPPSLIQVFIDGNPHNMSKSNVSNNNYVDGVLYHYITHLTEGDHVFYFTASDGLYTTREPNDYYSGPKVSSDGSDDIITLIVWLIIIAGAVVATVMIIAITRKKKLSIRP